MKAKFFLVCTDEQTNMELEGVQSIGQKEKLVYWVESFFADHAKKLILEIHEFTENKETVRKKLHNLIDSAFDSLKDG
jgi:hypothetical protein